MKKDRLLILGFDGTHPPFFEEWVEAGHLPVIGRLMKEGAYGHLRSVANMGSPAAWSTFATGVNPGKHSIFSFTQRDFSSYNYIFVNGAFRTSRTFWEILCGERTGCVINVPMTYPAQKINGCMIAGFDAPGVDSKGFCHPEGLLSEMVAKNGPYKIIRDVGGLLRKEAAWEKAGEEMLEYMEMRYRHAEYLMDKYDWDLFTVVFGETDHVQHFFWKFMLPDHPDYDEEEARKCGDTILRVYMKMDEIIGRFIEKNQDATVFVMSDHGGGLNSRGGRSIPDWLEGMGLLTRIGSDKSGPRQMVKRAVRSLAGKGYNLANRHLSLEMKFKLIKMMPMLRNRVESAMRLGGIDWTKTKAYSDGIQDEIWINLEGRDPAGIVPQSEYDELCDLICEELRQATDIITGEPLVEYIFRKEDAYSGDHLDKAPDIAFRWAQTSIVNGIRTKSYAMTTKKAWDSSSDVCNGGHSKDGIFLAYGPGIARGVELKGAQIRDVAPTVIYHFGEEIPADFDGKVLDQIFEPERFSAKPPRYGKAQGGVDSTEENVYQEEDSEIIEQRLRDLGYI